MSATIVTYFRTSLDPLDVYRIDDIISGGGEDDTTTPAAALATHLRAVNPALHWDTERELADVLAARYSTDSTGMVNLAGRAHFDAAVFEHDDKTVILAALRHIYGFSATARTMWFSATSGPHDLPRATTTGLEPVPAKPAYLGSSSRMTWCDTTTAQDIATRSEPIPTSVKIDFLSRHRARSDESGKAIPKRAAGATPPEVAGFVPVPWAGREWARPVLPAPGVDLVGELSGEVAGAPSLKPGAPQPDYGTENSSPAIVSCVYQGKDYAPLVQLTQR